MVQLQCMDACLDTLSMELYQVNVHVGRIARRQATMGSVAPEPTVGKSGFVSHTKHIAEATNMNLFHSWLITCIM